MKVVLANGFGESLVVDVPADTAYDAAQLLAPFLGQRVNVADWSQEFDALLTTAREELTDASEAWDLAQHRYQAAAALIHRLEEEAPEDEGGGHDG